MAVDAADPTSIVSEPSCDGGGIDPEVLHKPEAQVPVGSAPEPDAAPTCTLAGPCKMQHRFRNLSPVDSLDATVYCADDGSWWAFYASNYSTELRLEGGQVHTGDAVCFAYERAAYSVRVGGQSVAGTIGAPPKLPSCEPGCCSNVPAWVRESQ